MNTHTMYTIHMSKLTEHLVKCYDQIKLHKKHSYVLSKDLK